MSRARQTATAPRLKPVASPLSPIDAPSRPHLHLGQIVRVEGGRIWVDDPENELGPIEAQLFASVAQAELELACREQRPVVLGFAGGHPARPLVMGLLYTPSSTPNLDALLAPPLAPEPAVPKVASDQMPEELVLKAHRKVTLQCGEATISLDQNGKVTVRGAAIESRARGTHRIKGGVVKVN